MALTLYSMIVPHFRDQTLKTSRERPSPGGSLPLLNVWFFIYNCFFLPLLSFKWQRENTALSSSAPALYKWLQRSLTATRWRSPTPLCRLFFFELPLFLSLSHVSFLLHSSSRFESGTWRNNSCLFFLPLFTLSPLLPLPEVSFYDLPPLHQLHTVKNRLSEGLSLTPRLVQRIICPDPPTRSHPYRMTHTC